MRRAALDRQAVLWKLGSAPPSADAFLAVDPGSRRKPRGGLWTSTYRSDEISGWAEWCRGEGYACGHHELFVLTPDPTAEVYEIDRYDDLTALHATYGRTERRGSFEYHHIDWTLVGERFAGVHLTDSGQWATRLSSPYDLYGWDCESTLWFRWAFAHIEHLSAVEVKAADYEDADD